MSKFLPPMHSDPNEAGVVRELLDTGRSYQVADYDFDKGLKEHMSHLQLGTPAPDWAQELVRTSTPGGGAAGAASGLAAGSGLVTWVGVPLVAAAVIAAAVLMSEPEAPAVPVQAPPTGAYEAAPPTEPVAAAATTPEPEPEPESVATGVVERPSRSSERPTRVADRRPAEHATAPERTPARKPGLRGNLAPSETRGLDAIESVLEPAPATKPRAQERVARTQEPEAEPEPPVQPEPPAKPQLDDARLEREMRMLAMAQRLLQSDPGRSLRLARQGEHEFPDSMFTQERQQVLLLSLVKLGRMDEARRLANPYLKKYPDGPFSDRVRRALATGKVER